MAVPAFGELNNQFSAIYFDQRGCGESKYDLMQGITLEQITDDVNAVASFAKERFPQNHIYLWGGSFGGLLSLAFLQRYPHAVERAIVSSPAIFPGEEKMMKSNIAGLVSLLEGILSKESADKLKALLKANDNIYSDEVMSFLIKQALPYDGFENFWHLYAMRKWIAVCDLRPAIKTLDIDTLFLQGLEDHVCPANILVEAIQDYKNKMVTFKTFTPCGHAVFEDCANEFVKICTDFYLE